MWKFVKATKTEKIHEYYFTDGETDVVVTYNVKKDTAEYKAIKGAYSFNDLDEIKQLLLEQLKK